MKPVTLTNMTDFLKSRLSRARAHTIGDFLELRQVRHVHQPGVYGLEPNHRAECVERPAIESVRKSVRIGEPHSLEGPRNGAMARLRGEARP